MSDKIEGIRERHNESDNNFIEYESIRDIHVDRATLLAEVERQRAEIERLRAALTDMLAGWRYIRETYGDLAGIGWDRAESKAQEALEGKP